MLLTGPVGNLIHAVPLFQTALASVDRIQAFLKLDEVRVPPVTNQKEHPLERGDHTGSVENDEFIEMEAAIAASGEHTTLSSARTNLELIQVCVELGIERKTVLRGISVKVPDSSLTLILSPVGCGKTTLLRALIGDIPISAARVKHGALSAISAYCAQTPWLPSGTVSSLIVGPNTFDEHWLMTLVKACALDTDLAAFCSGLQTVVSPNGVSLSGGQRQRLALARALYTHQSLLVVDDSLSGLNANTSTHIFSEVFDPSGLCKVHNITAIPVTNDARHFGQADHIVVLGADG